MKWNYKCLRCGIWLVVEWEEKGEIRSCPECKTIHRVPVPAEQHEAYVDQHDWPKEMEDVVKRIKGSKCIIKGCNDNDITLDHINPWVNKDSRTSVKNLQPMCKSHNSSKKDQDFKQWLMENGLTTR